MSGALPPPQPNMARYAWAFAVLVLVLYVVTLRGIYYVLTGG